ncbi:nucleotidyltransferase domain-containing protein [Luteococcus sp. H138]|uniref:nucleotidyltransferase domain-containing protein n=1 Tax=unclassified Luteococcus TaxID=2639923 RepID=UPI00313EE7F9
MDVAEIIRTERTRRGLSLSAFARECAVPTSTVLRIESGSMTPTTQMASRLLNRLGKQLTVVDRRPSDALREHADEVLTELSRLGVENVRVFGSVARGTDTPDSDVDLLCDFPDDFGIRAFSLADELSDLLGFPVDLVSDKGSTPVIDRARAEAVPL